MVLQSQLQLSIIVYSRILPNKSEYPIDYKIETLNNNGFFVENTECQAQKIFWAHVSSKWIVRASCCVRRQSKYKGGNKSVISSSKICHRSIVRPKLQECQNNKPKNFQVVQVYAKNLIPKIPANSKKYQCSRLTRLEILSKLKVPKILKELLSNSKKL